MADWTARLSDLAAETGVPGAVLGIWVDGEETIAPYGVLNRGTGVEVTADSVFQVGSITKAWTASMIVQLAQEGRLELDDPVVKLLPEAPIGGRITVRQLLTHTSGLDGDVFTDTGRGDDCLRKYVGLLADVDRLFEPGTAYSYCNAGFVLLGRIIEVLDGPAGLITQSASDLLRFARLHLDDDRYARMREPQVAYPDRDGGVTDIGLAWRLYDWSGRKLFGHDGGTISQLSFLRIDPEARLAVCLLTNSGNGEALFDALASEVFTEYVGVGVPASPQPVEAEVGDEHLGRYERTGIAMEVLRRDGKLILAQQATGDRLAFAEEPVVEYELHPTEPLDGNHFVIRSSEVLPWWPVTFTPDYLFAAGRVTPRVQD